MNEVWTNIISFLGGGGVVIVVAIWILKNPSVLEKWAAWFFRTFSWVSNKLEYSNVASNIQWKVNTYGEKICEEVPEALPHAMKIEWVKNAQSVEASLRNGEIVVALDYSKDRDRNLVVSTLAYLSKGLLPTARLYIDPVLIQATDYTVAKRVFVSSGDNLATQYFFDKYLKPEMTSNPQLGKDCQSLDLLETKGLFTRIYLKQLKILGDKLYPATPNDTTTKESRDFINFLYKIASKERGVDVPGGLAFTGSKIRVSIMLVASQKTLQRSGTKAHERRIALCRNAGIEYLYLCGIGTNNILLAEHISKDQESNGTLMILDKQKFRFSSEGLDHHAICILSRLSSFVSSEKSELDIVISVVEEYIKEIEDGSIEIIYIARKSGVKSKIIVSAQREDIDAVALCADPVKLTGMQFALGGETVEFIKWSDEIESLVISSLVPLKPEKVVSVSVYPKTKTANVTVTDEEARAQAIGYYEINLQLAMELIGYDIVVEVAEKKPAS